MTAWLANERPLQRENMHSHKYKKQSSPAAREPKLLALALTGFVLATGCTDAQDQPVDDRDGDGVSLAQGDCDDLNHAVYPGAQERGADGIDSDCDGEDAPVMKLVWGKEADENLVDAVELMDVDADGTVSIDEFNEQCAKSAQLLGKARPGILQFHAACAGNNSCRGMVYQSWDEVYEHSCRGVNHCAGWSCVETAKDEHRGQKEAYEAGQCANCHTPHEENPDVQFAVPVPPTEDPDVYIEAFWESRSDEYLRSLIAFGAHYIAPNGYAVANMPPAYALLSRAEIDTVIAYLRTTQVEGEQFELPGAETWVAPTDAGDAGQSDAGSPLSDAN
jgi:Putative metal-binding motif/Cytochrome c